MLLEVHIKTSVVLTLKKEIYTCSFVVSSIQLLEKTDSSAKNTWRGLFNLKRFF